MGLAALKAAEQDPGNLSDEHALTLMTADGDLLEQVCRLADDLRKDTVGDDVTYVVNRNINFTNVCYVGCRFCAFAQRRTDADAYSLSLDEVADRAEEAWELGATEVCMQGGIDPELPADAYFELVTAVKQRVPDMHVHAFSPMEVVNGTARTGLSIEDFLLKAREAGLGSLPGTAAEILDDEVRWVLTKGKLPARTWIEVVSTAHRLGIPTTSTMMYGHVDNPRHWVGHLRVLANIQDETGGFTEFVPLPFVHTSAPIYLAGVARPGPTLRDNLAVHALARILLHGRIRNIQTSWVKLGVDGTRAMLRAGANDVGGTLMEETISRMAGSEHGSAKTVAELVDIGGGHRPPGPGAHHDVRGPRTALTTTTVTGMAAITVSGPPVERSEEILTDEALAFIADLQGRFGARRNELLEARRDRRARIAETGRLDFLPRPPRCAPATGGSPRCPPTCATAGSRSPARPSAR